MWDLIVSVPDHCLSFYLVFVIFLGVGGWLRTVIVALPGLFYEFVFCFFFHVRPSIVPI